MIAAALAFLTFASAAVSAQEWVTHEGHDYTIELPSHWKAGRLPDQFEGDEFGSHLRILKKSVDAKVSLEDLRRSSSI
jgi:hypothetical protein